MRTVAWHDAGGIARLELIDQSEPAFDRAVERRHMHREEQIAEEQRVGRRVGNGEVVVGVGGTLRLEDERASAEIEARLVLDFQRRQDDLDALEGVWPKHL